MVSARVFYFYWICTVSFMISIMTIDKSNGAKATVDSEIYLPFVNPKSLH